VEPGSERWAGQTTGAKVNAGSTLAGSSLGLLSSAAAAPDLWGVRRIRRHQEREAVMDLSGIASGQNVTQVHGTHGGRRELRAKVESAVADKLGMSVDDLKSQLATGKSMTDIAATKGVSKDELVSTISGVLRASRSGAGATASSATASSSASSSPADDLTQLATKIADRVGGHHGHSGPAGPSGSEGLRATQATTSAAELMAQLAKASSSGTVNDPDGDGDNHGSPSLNVASFNVAL
jgi:hypothetical protein